MILNCKYNGNIHIKVFYLLILLSMLLISSCAVEQEVVLLSTTQIEDPPATIEQGITRTPTVQNEESVETGDPTNPPEEEIMDSIANADVIFVRAVHDPELNSWTFHVTVQHPDTGWDDYADGWDVVLPDSTVIKPDPEIPYTHLLLHPHEEEQPFTRSQNGILIPNGITKIKVRAHDLVAGFGGGEIIVDLNSDSGPGFEVIR